MQNNLAQNLTNAMTPKFAVSYLRVSTRGQAERGGGADEGFSIPAQREANKKKALSMGAIVGKEFVDRGASARSADRPELQKMLEYIKENKERIDYVIVHKVDRLARNRGDDVDITRALQEANVQLVSASESIDESPAGMLVHGIMSSIAEWYSQNLAAEVKKGMNEKVKNGGSVCKAPIGYINVRKVDDKGREERTVEIDNERAPFVRQAFQEYASGKWTVRSLAEHLAALGFASRATPLVPSSPIARGTLNKLLTNPYYKGIVTYKGVEYKGNHTPLVDEEMWLKVQDMLRSHMNGERTREHPHFLKGSLFCKNCGSRMIVTYAKSRSGVRYPYFVCSGRHSKRTDCECRAVLIEDVERGVEQWYEKYSLKPEIREMLEKAVSEILAESQAQFEAEQASLKREKEKLERKRKKLLEAHYNDAIPMDLLRSEQAQINKDLGVIESQLKAHDMQYDMIVANLKKAFDLVEDCGRTYRFADEHIKKIFNQAMLEKIWVVPDNDVTAEFTEPFRSIMGAVGDDLVRYDAIEARGRRNLADYFREITNRIQYFFGCGLNKDVLVGRAGVEPATLSTSKIRSSQLS